MLKVAFVTHYGSLYGANRSLLALIDGLRDYNVKSFVVGREPGPIDKELEKRSVPFAVIPFEWWVRHRSIPPIGLKRVTAYKNWRKGTFHRLQANLRASTEIVSQL